MELCQDCQHRTMFAEDFYCELTGKLIAIDDFDCVNHEKQLRDIQTNVEIN